MDATIGLQIMCGIRKHGSVLYLGMTKNLPWLCISWIVAKEVSLVPRPPCPAFVTCSTKSGGGRPGRIIM